MIAIDGLQKRFGTVQAVRNVHFRAGDGTMSVTPASEYDGDASQIVREIDPFIP